MSNTGLKDKKAKAPSTARIKNAGNPQSKVLAERIVPEIPLEIHQTIIELIANEAAAGRKPAPAFLKNCPTDVWEETLSSCALACRNWHSLVIRERLRDLYIDMDNGTNDTDRLLELMQEEPLMAPSVRHLSVHGSQSISSNQWHSRNDPYRSLPWPSFTNISCLEVDIELRVSGHSSDLLVMSWPSISRDPFQFLEEAAKLATIETLVLYCDVPESVLADDAILDEALSDICSYHLNSHFYANTFPSLKTLSLYISIRSSAGADMTEAIFEGVIKDYLPSIFGPEGRVAEQGLDAKLYARLDVEEYDYDMDDDGPWGAQDIYF